MTEDQHALLIFGEELGEVASELLHLQNQVMKAIRFGIDEQRDLPTSNRERIEAEWNDLLGSLLNLSRLGITLRPDLPAIDAKLGKIARYTAYSQLLGEVEESCEWWEYPEVEPEDMQDVAFVVRSKRDEHLNGRILGGRYSAAKGVFSVPGASFAASKWRPMFAAPK